MDPSLIRMTVKNSVNIFDENIELNNSMRISWPSVASHTAHIKPLKKHINGTEFHYFRTSNQIEFKKIRSFSVSRL